MSEMKTCLFCSQNANYLGTGPLDQVFKIICNNCGTYYVSDIIADQDKDTVKSYTPYKHLISGLIREKNDLGC